MSYTGRRVLSGASVMIAVAIGFGSARISAAQADLINLNPCNSAMLTQPFAPYGDQAWYELAPGGDFEASPWTLHAGAQRVRGSEPYAATGSLGAWSLQLPAGAWAQSPSTCVDAAYPSLRFFIAGTGSVSVSVVSGNLEIPAGIAIAGSEWLPTPVMLTSSVLPATLSGGVAQVSLRIRALTGNPRVDDVYVDPWCRG